MSLCQNIPDASSAHTAQKYPLSWAGFLTKTNNIYIIPHLKYKNQIFAQI